MKAACVTCGWIHATGEVQEIGRFNPNGITGYRADVPGALVRMNRADAERDVCEARR